MQQLLRGIVRDLAAVGCGGLRMAAGHEGGSGEDSGEAAVNHVDLRKGGSLTTTPLVRERRRGVLMLSYPPSG
jgi:hypothetical protein